MFDKNYLGHDLSEEYKIKTRVTDKSFTCKKCCAEICYSIKNKKYNMLDQSSRWLKWIELHLTCNEVIIKRILE